ncbi:mechanosensitive ion channel family protein [Emticicia sp. C21]|uniref:mechanosensitive ion channel family protein n=1 Tax=Emticicia sp. C21 TaxID=2302915 RepID=UPI000E348584|nr:mechanosensitive ion channel domain-containing protein [Emticicia sp. C21]RFS14020.1 mechanosensitive ion channel family protein [Emticicia sp. C21]
MPKGFFLDFFHSVSIIVILIVALALSQLARKALNRYARATSRNIRINATTFSFLKNAISFVIFAVAIILVIHLIPGLEKLATTLWASAGILSVVIGLATQQTFGNIVSGIFIVIYKPFRIGDAIQLPNGQNGIVEDITLQFTVINNAENRHIIVPNSVITRDYVINSTIIDDKVCNQIDVKIVTKDIDRAMALLKEIAVSHSDFYDASIVAVNDDTFPKITPVLVQVIDLSDSWITLRLSVWCKSSSKAFAMKSDLLLAIKKRFEAEGIKI